MNSNKKNNTLTNIINNINKKDNDNYLTNINAVTLNDTKKSSIEDCKKVMSDYKIMPMFSVRNIIAGSIMPPSFAWIALLIIITFIILI